MLRNDEKRKQARGPHKIPHSRIRQPGVYRLIEDGFSSAYRKRTVAGTITRLGPRRCPVIRVYSAGMRFSTARVSLDLQP